MKVYKLCFIQIHLLYAKSLFLFLHSLKYALTFGTEPRMKPAPLNTSLVSNLFNLPVPSVHYKLAVIMTRKTILPPQVL